MAVATLIVLAGNGLLMYSGSPFVLQARSTALQARWSQMVVLGVPQSDLVALEHESATVDRSRILSVGSMLWWPDSKAIVDSWESQTNDIWNRNMSQSRSEAAAASEMLSAALGGTPIEKQPWQIEVLNLASSPADYNALAADWNLEAALVPLDRNIATLVGTAAALSTNAASEGIASAPARELLARARGYSLQDGPVRSAQAAGLASDLSGLNGDLIARLDAAAIALADFKKAADEISLAFSYGVDVSKYQRRVAVDRKAYATVTTVIAFRALIGDVRSTIAAAHEAGRVALVVMHTNGSGPGTYIINGVPTYYQTHSLSCEETATSMALRHQGLRISQDQILRRLGVDKTPVKFLNGRVVRWGDPDRAFVGNVNGSESNYTGQQANPKALVRVLNSYGARIIEWSEPGVTAKVISALEIYRQVAAGHPVVAYATWDWRWHPIYYYRSEDGNRVPLISPANDHVYVVVGVSPTRVLVIDPIRGKYWVSRRAFQAGYEFGMAIVLA